MSETVYIAFGSNVGDREGNLVKALGALARKCRVVAISSVYETEPWGFEKQPRFLNAVVKVEFDGEPEELLEILRQIEVSLGRQRRRKWAPRTIDLDILIFGSRRIDTPELCIPHKYLLLRDFFLVPLVEVDPDVVHPTDGVRLSEYAVRVPPQLRTIIGKKEVPRWQLPDTSP